MAPVFSAAHPSQEGQQHGVELQLLAADELMSLWEQTQRAIWAMEEKGIESVVPERYSQMVLWEMQRRVSLMPNALVNGYELAGMQQERVTPVAMPHIMTLRF